ncbi:hypothetical protein OK016_19370 [Vibrio chagasii]|nr:hypothetical protein [Vibrio chagasii]
MVQRSSLSPMARLQEPRRFQQKMMCIRRRRHTASATITDATGGNFESLVKDPTAATTTINDDSDVTTVSLSADASVTEGYENITYTATPLDESCGWRGDGTLLQWCNDHYR